MKFFVRIINVAIVLALVIVGVIVWQAKQFMDTPPQSPGVALTFDVPQGASFIHVANALYEKKFITDVFKFRLLARYRALDDKLQAGRFSLNTGWRPEEILNHLVHGQPILHRITLREGLTWWQVGQELAKVGFVRFADFQAVVHDANFLRHYGIPFATAEGFLMPDTYLLKKSDTPTAKDARAIAGRLVDTFWQKMAPYWPQGKIPAPKKLREIVILASIVEKETGIGAERARVAGVYANRLRIKMPLQADPTIIYGLGEGFDGNLRRVHLNDAKNVYNTYQHPGLPPGPICSPGVAALRAALVPEKHDFLYFVAITDGGEHAFSKNLRDHNAAVRRYLQNRRKKP